MKFEELVFSKGADHLKNKIKALNLDSFETVIAFHNKHPKIALAIDLAISIYFLRRSKSAIRLLIPPMTVGVLCVLNELLTEERKQLNEIATDLH